MHYIIHTDVKGWLPHAVVNAAMASNYTTFFDTLLTRLRHIQSTRSASPPSPSISGASPGPTTSAPSTTSSAGPGTTA
jgi:hypothetical protein